MKKPSARKAASSRSDSGTLPSAPLPMNTKRSGKPPIELPPFMVKARPWLIWPTTSVVMKAGTASLDTIRPLNRPRMIPASMPTAMLAGRSIPASIRIPLIIGQNASRPASDRSIPLMTMTNVIPTAQMPVMDDCLTTLSRFDGSRKCGTCEPSARKAATGIKRNSPRRAAGWRFTSSERPLAGFSQVALVVDHGAGVDHLGDAVGGLRSAQDCEQILNRDWTHLAGELSHGPHDGALFHEVHRLLGSVDRQDLDAGAVGVASGLEDAV